VYISDETGSKAPFGDPLNDSGSFWVLMLL